MAGSYNARIAGFASSALIALKASSYVGPHNHAARGLRSAQSGRESSASLGENFPSWFAMPTNLLSSVMFFGLSMLVTAQVLLGSAEMPCSLMTWPKKVMLLC